MRPVRPQPVIISSAMKSAPYSCASARTPARKPGGGRMLPAVPWIGSAMIAASLPVVDSLMVRSSISRSPQGER